MSSSTVQQDLSLQQNSSENKQLKEKQAFREMTIDALADFNFSLRPISLVLEFAEEGESLGKEIARSIAEQHNMTKIDLSSQDLIDSDMPDIVQALADKTHVTGLVFNDNMLGNSGMTEIIKLLSLNPAVQHIDIRENPFGIEAIRALVKFIDENPDRAKTLIIIMNNIYGTAAPFLSQALKKTATAKYLFERYGDHYVKEEQESKETFEKNAGDLVRKMLEDPSSLLTADAGYPDTTTIASMSLDRLNECHCGIATDRTNKFNFRKTLEDQFIKNHYNSNSRNHSFRLVSVGASSLFQEAAYIAGLLHSGYSNIHVDLIDLVFADKELFFSGKFDVLFIMVAQFITLLTAMGCKVESGNRHQNQKQDLLLIQKHGFEYYQKLCASKTQGSHQSLNQSVAKPVITITFFDSINAYCSQVPKDLQAILALDLDLGYNLEAILKPLLDLAPDKTFCYVLNLLWLDVERRDCFQMAVRQKVGSQWKLQLEQRVKVKADNSYQVLEEQVNEQLGEQAAERVTVEPAGTSKEQTKSLLFSGFDVMASNKGNQNKMLSDANENDLSLSRLSHKMHALMHPIL